MAAKRRPNKAERARTRAIEDMVGNDAQRAVLVELFKEFGSTIRTDVPYRQGIHEGKRELAMWWVQQCHNASKACGLRMLAALTGGVEEWQRQPKRDKARTEPEPQPEETEEQESP